MQSNEKAEIAARKLWVEPEFAVLNAEDAAANFSSSGPDFGIYS